MLGLKKTDTKHIILFAIFLFVAFIFRIWLSPFGNHIDLIINAGWGRWLWENGSKNFYTNNVWIYAWPTQLPLINLIYAYNFHIYERILWYIAYFGEVIIAHNVFPQSFGWLLNLRKWFGTDLYGETPFNNGFLISMKMIPVVSDLLIAVIIFLFGKKFAGVKKALLISTLFLFLPFSWYLSALWGQYDQTSSLLVLIAFFILVFKKSGQFRFVISPILLLLAFQTKPTVFFLIPLYIYIYLSFKPKVTIFILSIIAGIFMVWLTFKPFISGNFIDYILRHIYPVVFNNDRFGLVNRAFNFWSILAPFGGWSTTFKLFGIKALSWGVLFWVVLTLLAIRVFKKEINIRGIFNSLFLVSAGTYIFVTGMVDRYFYLAVIILALISFYRKRMFKYWLVLALLFSINLFYSWGYPFLTNYETWRNIYIIQLSSLAQLLVFLLVLRSCLKSS